MLTFDAASKLFTTARNAFEKPLGNNTKLRKVNEDTFAVRLHNTNVVLIHRGGTYTLNSGGWLTATTKDRINKYSPIKVYQKKKQWYIGDGQPFVDYMEVR